MSMNSLDQILAILEKQPEWEFHRRYQQLLQAWEKIIEVKVLRQTRPLYIRRQVLWVATSSATWAQTLSLQRYSLLKQLNALLCEPLVDIRFSSAQWHNRLSLSAFVADSLPARLEKHPSAIEPQAEDLELSDSLPTTPETALQRWVEIIKTRSQNLPLCPQCQSPTPPGELERWLLCAYCAAQEWGSNQQKMPDSPPL